MKLMISNDDGFHAQGIQTMICALKEDHQLFVVAPDRDRSGASNSLTLDRPLHPVYQQEHEISLNGTPTDCVHLGIHKFYKNQCERVISGINAGANLGDDVIYSGTVAAAMEGRFLPRTPIAVSLAGNTHFDTAAQVVTELLPKIDALHFPANSIININVPDVPYNQLRGVAVTRLGHRACSDNPVQTVNPRGKQCYWISAAGEVADAAEDTDFHAISQHKVSITPIQMDMTNHQALATLKQELESA